MPGSIVTTVTPPPVNGPPTDTGTAFIAMPFQKGPTTPQLITSPARAAQYGDDTSYSIGARCLEAFFRIGGRRAWVNRVVGPDAESASITLNGAGATASVTFTAGSVGDWANALRLAVIAGTGATIILVLSDAAGELARSGELATKADVLAYTGFSTYGAFSSAGAGTLPVVVAAANLTGGDGDEANITDVERQAALDAFTRQMGPGQILMPGDTREAAGIMLGATAAPMNRVALYDLPDDPLAGTVTAAALALRGDVNAGALIAVAPWAIAPPAIPGGTDRDLPYSIVQAAVIARQDALTGNPNQPAAGDNGIAPWITGVKNTWTEAERDTLNDAGVNVALDLYGNGQIRMYGNRTLVDPETQALYLQASNVRLDMLIRARGGLIADRYVFKQIDGKGRLAAKYGGELETLLAGLPDGALYALVDSNGDLIDPGYIVDTSTGEGRVNTPESIAALQIRAVVGARRSPGSELVFLEIVNNLVTEEF